MKIAIFTNNYLPNPYGVSGSVESFRKSFESLGHKVYIFAPKWKDFQDSNPNVFRYPSIETNIKKIRFPLAIPYSRRIGKMLDNLDLDIIHSQHPNLLGSTAKRWAKKKNIPIVFTWHTLYDRYVHFVPFLPRKLAANWAIRNAKNYANQCDAVIVPTPSVIGIIRKWGVVNKNVMSIPTGVEEKLFASPNRESVRSEYNIKDNEILLLVMARLTVEKNVDFLVEAIIETLRRNVLAKFMVCGDGDLKDELIKKVFEAGLKERVFFVGIVPEAEKKNYYAAGDIFVYASKSETQGMVLTEAMYSGLPIVAVRATGVQDIIESDKTGFLVPEDRGKFIQAVQKLIDGKDLRRGFGEKAKKIAREKYTSSVCAKKMLEVYEKIRAKS